MKTPNHVKNAKITCDFTSTVKKVFESDDFVCDSSVKSHMIRPFSNSPKYVPFLFEPTLSLSLCIQIYLKIKAGLGNLQNNYICLIMVWSD